MYLLQSEKMSKQNQNKNSSVEINVDDKLPSNSNGNDINKSYKYFKEPCEICNTGIVFCHENECPIKRCKEDGRHIHTLCDNCNPFRRIEMLYNKKYQKNQQ